MADVKDLLIRMSLDSTTFKRNIQDAKSELRTLKSEYKAISSSDDIGKAGANLLQNLQDQKTTAEALVAEYNKGIAGLRARLNQTTPGSQAAFQMEQQIQKLENGLARAKTQVNELQSQIDGVKLDNFIAHAESVASTMMNLRIGFSGLLDATGLGETADKSDSAYVSREAAFVQATKNVEDAHQTKEDLDALNASLREMTTVIPQTYQELSALMGVGATLGVPYENLMKFTEVMAKLNVATNVQGETGAQLLAQLLNITEKDYANVDRAGAALTELGNNSATTEQAILEMAQRAATGLSAVGMGLDDILAISAAINSVGINAEAGGSSVSKLAIKMDEAANVGGQQIDTLVKRGQLLYGKEAVSSIYELYALLDSLPSSEGWRMFEGSLGMTAADTKKLMNSALAAERFSQAMGMTVDEFATGWNEDAASQMLSFFRTLGEMDGTDAGENMLWTMDQLGITEIRQSNMVRALAGNWELYAKMLDLGREAYAENVALENESQRAFSTTESQRVMNANKEENALEALGKSVTAMRQPFDDFFADMKQGFAEMPELVQQFAAGTVQAIDTLDGALEKAGQISFSILNIANAVKSLESTSVGASLLKKMGLVTAAAGNAAATAAPGLAFVGLSLEMGRQGNIAYTEETFGGYNQALERSGELMDTAGEKMTRLQELFAAFATATESEDYVPAIEAAWAQFGDELLAQFPELQKDVHDNMDAFDWAILGAHAVEELAKGIDEKQAGLESAAQAAGLQVDAGLAEGIYTNADQAIAAASWLAGQVEDQLRVDLDIHSPSGVAETLGAYFAEGFARGLESGVERVERSLNRLTDAVTPKLDGNGNPVSRNVNVTLALDGEVLAQSLAPFMDTALGDLAWGQ